MPNKNPSIFPLLYPDPGALSNFRLRILRKNHQNYRWVEVPQVRRKGQDYIGEDGKAFK